MSQQGKSYSIGHFVLREGVLCEGLTTTCLFQLLARRLLLVPGLTPYVVVPSPGMEASLARCPLAIGCDIYCRHTWTHTS
jgi:hypothetical protein